MANEASRKIYVHPAPDGNPYADRGEKGYFVQNIKIGDSLQVPIEFNGEKYDGQKFEFFVPLPVLPDDCMEALDQECKTLLGDEFDAVSCLINGIRQAMYALDVSKDTETMKAWEAGDAEGAHRAAAVAYADYRVGRRAQAGTTTKIAAKKYKAAEADASELGMTVEEAMALLKAAKAEGKI